jgi:glycosyltransferase involved in cell wall biosynthesis
MKIGVIIPLLNRGQYISRAIDSVLSQSYQHFEVIVVDGGSIDNGPDIVKGYKDERIKIINQSSKGVSAARNEGVANTAAEFISFLDADDEWTSDHLESIMDLYTDFPEAGLYSSSYEFVYSSNYWVKSKCYGIPSFGLIDNYFKSASRGEPPVWTSVAGLRKEIFLEFGGFKEGYQFGEDLDLWGRIALRYPIAFVDRVGGKYHCDANGRICQKRWLNIEQPFKGTIIEAIKKDEIHESIADDVNEYLNRLELQMVIEAIKENKREIALRRLLKIKTQANISLWIRLLVTSILPELGAVRKKIVDNY